MNQPSGGESEIHRRLREGEEERETGWHAGGGRPFGHPDDVISPAIRALQLVGLMRRDTRPRPMWFKVARVLALAVLAMIVLPIIIELVSTVVRVLG